MGLYLIGYAVIRIAMEYFRGDPRVRWAGFAAAQYLSLALLVLGLLLWCRTRACHGDQTLES